MGGVDLSDQIMNYYHFLHRGNKWWWKLCVHLFNMAVSNGHVLNKTFGTQNKLSHHEYRYMLAAALLDFTELDRPIGRAARPNNCRRGHWPERLDKSTKTNKTKTRKCKYCFVSAKQAQRYLKQRNEKSTTIICNTCRVPLCIDPCFRLFHTSDNNT